MCNNLPKWVPNHILLRYFSAEKVSTIKYQMIYVLITHAIIISQLNKKYKSGLAAFVGWLPMLCEKITCNDFAFVCLNYMSWVLISEPVMIWHPGTYSILDSWLLSYCEAHMFLWGNRAVYYFMGITILFSIGSSENREIHLCSVFFFLEKIHKWHFLFLFGRCTVWKKAQNMDFPTKQHKNQDGFSDASAFIAGLLVAPICSTFLFLFF